MQEHTNINVLYLDDEEQNVFSFKANLREDFTIFTSTTPDDAYEILKNNDIHIIITDMKMPKVSGIEFLRETINISPNSAKMVISAYTDVKTIIESVNDNHILYYISKPINFDELKSKIISAFNYYNIVNISSDLIKKTNSLFKEKVVLEEKLNDIKELLLSNKIHENSEIILDIISK